MHDHETATALDETDDSDDDMDSGAYNEQQDESSDPLLEESGCTKSTSSDDVTDDEEIDELVLEDMQKFEETFKGITKRYRLLNRIGEGIKSLSATTKIVTDLIARHLFNCV